MERLIVDTGVLIAIERGRQIETTVLPDDADIAIATPQRNPALPDVPTTTEAGLPDFQASAWNALFAPKGTPKPVIEKLEAALSKALDDEGVKKRLLELGSDIPDGPRRGGAALGTLVKSEVDKWGKVIRDAGAVVN